MNQLKNFFFLNVCFRCLEPEENFFCCRCLLGLELGKKVDRYTAYLFQCSMNCLLSKNSRCQEALAAFCIIQLYRLGWKFYKIETEPSLLFLKKSLSLFESDHYTKRLVIVTRRKDPILLQPIDKGALVLIV